MFERLRNVTKAMTGETPVLGATAHERVDGSIHEVFSAGTSRHVLPVEVGRLQLLLSEPQGRLEQDERLGVRVDLREIGRIADVLMTVLPDGSSLDLDMAITRLDLNNIRLEGLLPRIGRCALGIQLRDMQQMTAAAASLSVQIDPPALRIAAATQQREINGLLQGAMNDFIGEYKRNIEAEIAGQQTIASA